MLLGKFEIDDFGTSNKNGQRDQAIQIYFTELSTALAEKGDATRTLVISIAQVYHSFAFMQRQAEEIFFDEQKLTRTQEKVEDISDTEVKDDSAE